MRRCAIAGLVGLAVLLGLAALAVSLIDGERLRPPLARFASDALGREVELGEVGLSLFPLPAVEVDGLRVAGADSSGPPLASVESLRLRVAFWPLLSRQVAVRTLHVIGPAVDLSQAQENGTASAGSSAPPPGPDESGSSGEQGASAEAPPFRIAIQSVRVERGSLRYGDWSLEGISASGGVGLDLEGTLEAELDVSGPASLRDLEMRLEFALEPDGRPRSGRLRFEAGELSAGNETASLRGPVSGQAVLGETWRLDLTRTAVRAPGAVEKAPGQALRLAGPLPADLAAVPSPHPVRVELADAALELELDPGGRRVTLGDAGLELASLHPYLDPGLPRVGGRVRFDGLGARLDPLRLFGSARLEAVEVPLPWGDARVSGLLRGRGDELELKGARLRVAEQDVIFDASYVLETGAASLAARTRAVRVEPLIELFAEDRSLGGRLDSSATLSFRSGIESLRGQVRLDLRDGRIYGFSLLRQLLGRLAELPVLVASLRGKDLSKYEDERFERLSGTFEVRGQTLSTRDLTLEYRYATAQLRGSVDLQGEGALDLRGRAVLSREVDAELGMTSGRRSVIPIPRIGGTLSRPRVEIDERVLAELALAYTTRGRVRRKLDEKLGSGAADAVEGLLDLLRGRGEP